ncbi:MAG: GSCFA domain-containing protein [Tannerella sp.]|jgi:hypothetical protein|nr:GSCFA domain-containing protein [Tannerella sp.]
MNFLTHIELPPSKVRISCGDSLLLLGSCFAESMGHLLTGSKFRTDVNPFGVLYNPSSIAMAIRQLLNPKERTVQDLFSHEGLYHSFSHHSSFSSVSETDCLRKINEQLRYSSGNLQHVNRLCITFGTAYVYRLKESGQVVANCHKLPDKRFDRERLPVSQITDEWVELLSTLFNKNESLRCIFTVSPIRHWKDGAHENQLSKSTLLLAIEQIQRRFPEQVAYFPAYEVMMDELRDYRFYADDMFHPSSAAVRYIWERFVETYMDAQTRTFVKEIEEIQKALNHKPLNPKSDSYKHFVMQTLLKMERLHTKMPYLCFEKEMDMLKRFVRN